MKKLFTFSLLIVLGAVLFANGFKISEVEYNITGCGAKIFGETQDYVLEKQVPVDKKSVFPDRTTFEAYINDYIVRLNNLRAFDSIDVQYEYIEDEPFLDEQGEYIYNTKLIVTVVDSFHLFAIPGPKYDSNTGLTLKLKIKDSNFLGSLNTLSSDIYFMFPTTESDASHSEFGFNANFDYPFKLGIFDATWLNDFGISYTIGDSMPEWNIGTGLRFELPVSKHALIFEANQKFNNNFAYKEFDDNLYFVNDFKISFPLKIAQLKYCGPVTYTPYFVTSVNWDFDGISTENSSLSSPVITGGHKISFGRSDWIDNLRTGYSFYLDNYYTYNFQRQRFYPLIEMGSSAYKKIELFGDTLFLRSMGLAADFHAFTFLFNPENDKYIDNDGKSIGSYLRGIRDNQIYDFEGMDREVSALNPTNAIILNLDFPIHIFRTNFTKSFLKYCNFDLQLSPFIDMALCYNKITKTYLDPKDGFYASGVEVIVYPLKWSGITIRGSIGIDVGRRFLSNYINTWWRENVSIKEFSLGFGLHY